MRPERSVEDILTLGPNMQPDRIEYPLGKTTALPPPPPPVRPDDATLIRVAVERFNPDKLLFRSEAPDRSVFVNVALVSVAPERSTARIERFAKV